MPISATGSKTARPVPALRRRSAGFSLVELSVVMAIAGLLLAVAVPASMRFYEGMQTRQAVRDALTLLASARQLAINSGRAQDVLIQPFERRLSLNQEVRVLPESLRITVHGSRELNRGDAGVIRFYPEGGSSGGGLDIEHTGREGGISIAVDWLVGRVTQAPYGV